MTVSSILLKHLIAYPTLQLRLLLAPTRSFWQFNLHGYRRSQLQ